MAASPDLRRYLRNPGFVVGAVLALAIALAAIAAPVIAPYDPTRVAVDRALTGPSLSHLFGTDQFGRDVFSRVLYGARVSLLVGVLGTALAFAAGVTIGVVAAYVGGWVDDVSMRIMDVIIAFPYVVLGIGLIAIVGPSLLSIAVVIGVLRVTYFARVARASVLSVKEREFVLAARLLGQPARVIMVRHLLPNILAPLIAVASLSVATGINAEAALSFLGVGIQPPDPSWGTLIADGTTYLVRAPWIVLSGGLAIAVTIFAYILLSDGLQDLLDPRGRKSVDAVAVGTGK